HTSAFDETASPRSWTPPPQRRKAPVSPGGETPTPPAARRCRGRAAPRSGLGFSHPPPYASELNPVEPVWSNLKRSLANLTKHNINQLTALIKTRLRRMQYRPGLLDGFLAKTGLDLTLLR